MLVLKLNNTKRQISLFNFTCVCARVCYFAAWERQIISRSRNKYNLMHCHIKKEKAQALEQNRPRSECWGLGWKPGLEPYLSFRNKLPPNMPEPQLPHLK